jgi:4-hydroxythreonine-4-phosphate dehydrogenase
VLPVRARSGVTPGRTDERNARYVLECLDRAVTGCRDGAFDALITGPVNKAIINAAGIPFTGHTEYLAQQTRASLPVMMLVAGGLRVALVTTHVPLRLVGASITAERIVRVVEIVHDALATHFGIPDPRITVCGLNPHAGEGGYLGDEETRLIEPALARLRRAGVAVTGPIPADTAFIPPSLAACHAVVAMYHDQGLPVLKAMGFGRAVNVTLGLPFVRVSVDHGTALELAGSGRADAGSLRAALDLAIELAARRAAAA